ncbi:efflux RND transporter permease subunit [Carboxylicivirga sediminis]|uniref:Efflux RND transporter permease subunit n=1 Tax=Carboxylicivirga sediminis TaxID=2006564 RepID=A0A941F6K3_9BACT|nr:efflux RND transporter permease subunit [Carboxylicivirga sediminis]MBR8536180.1 efflux RND transporter permease subunit [Carboxylicivirga sediminis]
MRAISRFSVNYPVTVLMIVLGIILLGGISLTRLGTDLFPDLQNPKIYAEIVAGERSPEEIEKRFVEQVEALAVRQSGVLNVSSVSRVGSAVVTVEYDWGKDIDEAFLDLQKALTQISQDEDVEELNISRFDPNASPVIKAAFSNDDVQDMNALRKVAENYIRNELIRIEGIADIRISGEEEAEVMVVADPQLLDANGLTTASVLTTINNFNQNVSGGSIEEMGQRYIIKGLSALTALNDVENLVVKLNQSGSTDNDMQSTGSANQSSPVLLKDVARVMLQNREPESIVRLNGQRCLGISIYKETRFNTVEAVEKLEEAFVSIQQRLPGYKLQVINNQGAFIQSAIGEVQESALIGIVLAVFILFVFLRRFGVTLIVSLAIPISIIATFNLMYFNGLTLNIMTLGGLALGAGMLVDNAIVVVENIVRKLEEGLSIKEAAVLGTSEVGGALTASTLTTIVVFLPIVYLHGASGELFKDQAWTVAFSLLSSLVVALLVIPVLSVLVFKTKQTTRPAMTPKEKGFKAYQRFLENVLERRAVVLFGAIALVTVTVLIMPIVGSEFMPETQSNEVTVETIFPAGTSLNRTDATLNQMEEMVMAAFGDQLKWIYTHAGPETASEIASTGEQGENTGFIKLVLNEDVHASFSEIIGALNKLFADIDGLEMRFVQDQSALQTLLGTDEAPLVIEIEDDNKDNLEASARLLTDFIRQHHEIYNVKSSLEDGAPEVNVVIDRVRAGIFDLNVSSIMNNLSDYLSKKDAGRMEVRGELTNISLQTPDVRLDELASIKISEGAKEVLLSEVATITIGKAPREVLRNNQKRVIRLSANVTDDRPFDHFVTELEQAIEQLPLEATSTVKVRGEEEKRKDAFGNLQFALILSIILVYMVMASQFESLLHPFTILLTVPLAGVGAVWAFFLLGHTFNIMAYIGIVMLAGIAVNDSIILVDAINQYKRNGMVLKDAIVAAGQQRVRPILMTSLTTILALLPLTFGFGDSAALRAPMAIAVIGGLITSTLLTLVVIPCVYYVFDNWFSRSN